VQYLDSPFGGAQISRLVFGCAPAGGSVGREQALRAMHRAHEAGVTAYDTARSYGYGESEEILGEFLRGKRDRVAVFSKAGIRSLGSGRTMSIAKDVARRVFSAFPALRAIARSGLGKQHHGGQFEPNELRDSVHDSLRALGTDRLDVLFLHDVPAEISRRDDVFETLERLVAEGKVLGLGVSGAPRELSAFRECEAVRAFQFAASASQWSQFPIGFPPAPGPRTLRLGNRVFADLLAWQNRGLSGADAAEACLRAPIVNGVCDALVASMYNPNHIRANVHALSEPSVPDEILFQNMNSTRNAPGSAS